MHDIESKTERLSSSFSKLEKELLLVISDKAKFPVSKTIRGLIILGFKNRIMQDAIRYSDFSDEVFNEIVATLKVIINFEDNDEFSLIEEIANKLKGAYKNE